MTGRLIVLEGGEGSGKSTQAALLAGALGAVLTREPGGTPTGEAIRALLLDPDLPAVDPRTETLLLLAARARHVAAVIRPALDAGRDVVCDRFSGSTLAYQGYGRGLPLPALVSMSDWAADGVAPDVVVLLEVSPAVAAARLAHRRGAADRRGGADRPGAIDRLEGEGADRLEGEGTDFFSRVAAGFDLLAADDPIRWRVVDGDGDIASVAAAVSEAVRALGA